jgi:hypothetical protein
VLAYSAAGRVAVVDPLRPTAKLFFPAVLSADPKELARAVQGPEVSHAIVLPLPLPEGRTAPEVFAVNESRSVHLPQ